MLAGSSSQDIVNVNIRSSMKIKDASDIDMQLKDADVVVSIKMQDIDENVNKIQKMLMSMSAFNCKDADDVETNSCKVVDNARR
jgi:hypothetical protein